MGTNFAALGVHSRFGILVGNAASYNSSAASITQQFVIRSESLKNTGTHAERDGLRGTRTHTANDTRMGIRSSGGTVEFDPSPQDLSILLGLILGNGNTGAMSGGNSFTLAESLPYFYAAVDRVTEAFEYYGCKVDRATFSGSKGTDPTVKLSLEISAVDELMNTASTFFGATSLNYYPPYIFTDIIFGLGDGNNAAVSRQAESFTLTIENHLKKDRFMNQLTVVDLPEEDRTITLEVNLGFTSNNLDLYNQALLGSAGWLVLAQAGTNYSTNFQFSTLQVPPEAPTVSGKDEIMLPLRMTCRGAGNAAGAGSELTVIHSSTP